MGVKSLEALLIIMDKVILASHLIVLNCGLQSPKASSVHQLKMGLIFKNVVSTMLLGMFYDPIVLSDSILVSEFLHHILDPRRGVLTCEHM